MGLEHTREVGKLGPRDGGEVTGIVAGEDGSIKGVEVRDIDRKIGGCVGR